MKKKICMFLFILGTMGFIMGVGWVFPWWINLRLICFSPWLWLPQVILWAYNWSKKVDTYSGLLNYAIATSLVTALIFMLFPVIGLIFNLSFIFIILCPISTVFLMGMMWILVLLEKGIKKIKSIKKESSG